MSREKPSKECPICVSNFNKSSCKEVSCPYCLFIICTGCVKRRVLDTLECMNCKNMWNIDFVRENTPKTWYEKEYKDHRKKLLLERERMLLQSAIPLLKERQVESKYKKEVSAIDKQMAELERRKRHLNAEKTYLINRVRNADALGLDLNNLSLEDIDEKELTSVKKEEKKEESFKFIKPCPANDCRGFLSTAWKCEVCEIYVCKDCHVIKKSRNDDDHKCNQDDIKSAEFVMKDSKPCPSCGTRIHRIDGCNDMFCTNCKTCFNYKTGTVTKSNTNPHYATWARNNNVNPNETSNVNLRNPCGVSQREIETRISIILKRYKNEFKNHSYLQIETFFELFSFLAHTSLVEMPRFSRLSRTIETSKLNLRVKYLDKEINETEWKRQILMREKKLEYENNMHQLYEILVTVIRETINKLSTITSACEFIDTFEEIVKIIDYFNTHSRQISKNMSYSKYDLLELEKIHHYIIRLRKVPHAKIARTKKPKSTTSCSSTKKSESEDSEEEDDSDYSE